MPRTSDQFWRLYMALESFILKQQIQVLYKQICLPKEGEEAGYWHASLLVDTEPSSPVYGKIDVHLTSKGVKCNVGIILVLMRKVNQTPKFSSPQFVAEDYQGSCSNLLDDITKARDYYNYLIREEL